LEAACPEIVPEWVDYRKNELGIAREKAAWVGCGPMVVFLGRFAEGAIF
jgi:hypothetical protein